MNNWLRITDARTKKSIARRQLTTKAVAMALLSLMPIN